MSKRIWRIHICSALVLVTLLAATVFGQTSGSLSGIVQDQQGNVIADVKVTVTEPIKNIKLESTTTDAGVFSFPTLQPGTYTLTAEAPGFKQLVKTGIVINTADKQSAGTLVMEVGEVSATVTVTAEAAQLIVKKESGEQSELITGRQLRELALNGRNYLDLMKLAPGVQSQVNAQRSGPQGLGDFTINGTRGTQHNLTIDGSTNVDTGSNGTQHVVLNLDAIEEFKILTSNYQAEYGRSGGGDIKITTRGGGKEFHSTAYLFHRHEGLNANTFFNNAQRSGGKADPVPRSLYRFNYFGYNVGGPVKLPKEWLKEKLFFFWGQEWHRQLIPTTPRQVRVPTAAELAGDFSQTRDGNNNLITIRDPQTGQPFAGNRIPANRFNQSGLAILKLFNKHENKTGGLPIFNHLSQISSTYPRRQENVRIDYNVTDNTRVFGRFTQDSDEQILPYGVGWTSGQNFPLTPTIFKQGPARNAALNITTSLSPTMTNEFIFGPSQNNLTLDPVDSDAATFKGLGLTFTPPFPYAPGQFINITFGGTTGVGYAGITDYTQFPYKNSNTTFDFIDNVSKVWGTHTTKAGIFVQRNRKDQVAGTSMRIAFSHNSQNPDNTGHPFANALLGNFDSLSEPAQPIYQGQYRYTNVEWFVQDNWKTTNRLTLDYGMRFFWIQPQYDQRLQDAYFNPNFWDPAKAVRLYQRVRVGNTDFAVDPKSPSVRLPGYLIGRIVPGSGDPFNGLAKTKDGYFRGGLKSPGIAIGPTLGFAYDIFGNGKTVLRGGYRIGFDRVPGNVLIFPATSNPPSNVVPTFNFGNLDTVGLSTGQVALAPVDVHGADPNGKPPYIQSYSLQVQQEIGFDTVVSVAYVGTLSRRLPQSRNLNFIPYGTTFRKEAQDPANFGGTVPNEDPTIADVYKNAGLKFDGSKALRTEFLRRYPGYNTIRYWEFAGSANYHSMQATVQRRYKQGLTYGLSYTWSKAMGTASADGDFSHPTCTRCYDYRLLSFDRKHILAINYVWNLPRFSKWMGDHFLAKQVFDGWELSGITQMMSGTPSELGFGISNLSNLNQRITGSPTEGPRFRLVKNPQKGLNRSREQWFDFTAFRLPDIGDTGPWPRTYMRNPGVNVTDLSIFKNFALGNEGRRRLQLRVEMFNVFNHAQFSGFNGGMTYEICTNFKPSSTPSATSCVDYVSGQQASARVLRNVRGGAFPPSASTDRLGRAVGEFSGQPGFVSANRVIQLAAKLYF